MLTLRLTPCRAIPWNRAALLPALLTFWLVLTGQSSAQATINVPKDQPTIQSGIDAAQNGDTVLVAPGTYNESIDFKGKAITVKSSGGAASTIIDGTGRAYAAIFQSNEPRSSILRGFTIQHGGSVQATTLFGGVVVSGARPTISGNTITGNFCYGVYSAGSSPLIENNVISNTTNGSGKCQVPYVGDPGGFLDAGGAGVLLNASYAYRGPESFANSPQVIGNIIENNTVTNANDGVFTISIAGAGINDFADFAIIENNTIRNNATSGYGYGAGAYIFPNIGLIFAQNLVYGNQAGCGGGGIADFLVGNSPTGATEVFFVNNTVAYNTITTCLNPSFAGTKNVGGSQLYYTEPAYWNEFVNNLIVADSTVPALLCPPTYGPNVGTYWDPETVVLDHNDIFNSNGPAYGGTCSDQTGSFGNLSVDPQFVDAANGDFQLKTGSAAIDAANNSALQQLTNNGFGLTDDLSGSNARIQDATGKRYPIVDMGAYEHTGTADEGATTLLLTPSDYGPYANTRITLTAKLYSPNGIPSGTATFFEEGKQIGTAAIDGTGTATFLTAPLAYRSGVVTFLATYAGQGVFSPAVSVRITIYISLYQPTITATSTPNPSLIGGAVTFKAKLSSDGGAPTGNLQFNFPGPKGRTLGSVAIDNKGNATFVTTALPVGTDDVAIVYPGDAVHANSETDLTQTVVSTSPTSVAVSSSLNPADRGQPVTFSATVSSPYGTPSAGSVAFSDGTTLLATQPLANGAASFTTSSLTIGSHTIAATYQPSKAVYSSSSASLVEVINELPSTTTIVSNSPASPYALQPDSLTASVTGQGPTPTGTVTFTSGGAAIGTATLNSAGKATIAYAFPNSGNQSITATYNADANYAMSTSAPYGAQIVINNSAIAVSIAPNPARAFTPTYSIVINATATSDGATLTHSAVVTLQVKSLFK